jgi:hypothetical protein
VEFVLDKLTLGQGFSLGKEQTVWVGPKASLDVQEEKTDVPARNGIIPQLSSP